MSFRLVLGGKIIVTELFLLRKVVVEMLGRGYGFDLVVFFLYLKLYVFVLGFCWGVGLRGEEVGSMIWFVV